MDARGQRSAIPRSTVPVTIARPKLLARMNAIASLESTQGLGFGLLLRGARAQRGMRQAVLAELAGVSTRHISFLENSRARQSRLMVGILADACQATREERERLFCAAGFVTLELGTRASCLRLDHEIEQLVARQGPFPALVSDEHWNLKRYNGMAERLLACWLKPAAAPLNLLQALCADQGCIVNRQELAATLSARLGTSIELPRAAGSLERARELGSALMPFYPLVVASQGLHLNLVACVSPFSARPDERASSLRLHVMLPADDATLLHFRGASCESR